MRMAASSRRYRAGDGVLGDNLARRTPRTRSDDEAAKRCGFFD